MKLSVARCLALAIVLTLGLHWAAWSSSPDGLAGEPQAPSTPTIGGALPIPLPLLPPDNWWNLDISDWPLDPGSAGYISFIGPSRGLHPDFGGEVSPGSTEIYGMPYVIVGGGQAKRAVEFDYWEESDGVDHGTGQSYPFYPIPNEAITQPHWIEGGYPGNTGTSGDRHMLIADRDNNLLYELYALEWSGSGWEAGSGAFFDLNTNDRRPEGWTSADAAGLAILPGLIRYDEVFGPDEIDHAFRFTVRATNGHVYPASHTAGGTSGALPMGARLRLKAATDISSFPPEIRKIFRAMKTYGLIVADNGSDMFIQGTFDTRWDNEVLNPAFGALHASDFEVVQLGYNPSPPPPGPATVTPSGGTTTGGTAIVVTGTGFNRRASVQLGGTPATDVEVDRSTRLRALTPAHASGTVALTVTNPDTQSGSLASAFTYCTSAPAPPTISSAWWVPIDSQAVPASVPFVSGRSWVWSLDGGMIMSGQGTNSITLDAGTPGTTMDLRVSEVPADGCASAAAERGIQVDFLDVPPSHGFHDFVDTIALRQVTGGCGNGSYCPGNPTTRGQMAVFVLRAHEGAAYTPPACVAGSELFGDVPATSPFCAYIEELANRGVVSGCGGGNFCPANPVSREQMPIFALRTLEGPAYSPIDCVPGSEMFADVPATSPFCEWIEEFARRGITSGCGGGNYCPGDSSTRGQMAVFLTVTFGL